MITVSTGDDAQKAGGGQTRFCNINREHVRHAYIVVRSNFERPYNYSFPSFVWPSQHTIVVVYVVVLYPFSLIFTFVPFDNSGFLAIFHRPRQKLNFFFINCPTIRFVCNSWPHHSLIKLFLHMVIFYHTYSCRLPPLSGHI